MEKFVVAGAKDFVTQSLKLLGQSTTDGLNAMQEEDLKSNLADWRTTVEIDVPTHPLNQMLNEFNLQLESWCKISGRGGGDADDRRRKLEDMRSRYTRWCLRNRVNPSADKTPESTLSNEQDKIKRRLAQIRIASQLEELPGVFVVGVFDALKTCYVQQRRAIALVRALAKSKEIGEGKEVAIIGGGISGLTAGVAAAVFGAKTIILEKQSELLPLQRGNVQRYLHPTLHLWPKEESLKKETTLPFLNWRAATSSDVAKQIEGEFQVHQSELEKNLIVNTSSEVVEINPSPYSPSGKRLKVITVDNRIYEVDSVILAVGYGVENRHDEFQTPLYWDNDSLNEPIGYSADNPETVLVSGTGDGALLDTIRAAIRFPHNQILELLPSLASYKEALLEIEHEAEAFTSHAPGTQFDFPLAYTRLFETFDCQPLIDRSFAERKVYLNHRAPEVFSLFSSVLNRVIVFLLHKAGVVTFIRGSLYPAYVSFEDGKYFVRFKDNVPPQDFHRLIIRHGIDFDEIAKSFPLFGEATVKSSTVSELRNKSKLNVTSEIEDEVLFGIFEGMIE